MKTFKVNINDGGQRVDKFIQKTTWGLPLSLMYKFIRTKKIKVNGKRIKENVILNVGDTVDMYIPDEFFSKIQTSSIDFSNVTPKLSIVYEDENIIICDKAPGVLVHNGDENDPQSTITNQRNTLLFNIQAYLYQKNEYNPNEENSFAPSLCNRIDRNTGGLVIAAKNAIALREVNQIIKDNNIEKKYLCVVHGRPNPKVATLNDYLFKNTKTKTVTVSKKFTKGSKEIITKYTTLDYNSKEDLSLLEVTLITGRTHQIRAHLSFYGYPLLGEGKYNVQKSDKLKGYKYQALYSYKMTFHVNDGVLQYLNNKTFSAPKNSIYFLDIFKK